MTDQPYEDADFVEEHRLESMTPGEFLFLVRHKASENIYEVRAKDRAELADKVAVGDWRPDPRNQPDPYAEDEDDD